MPVNFDQVFAEAYFIALVELGPMALFNEYELSIESGKEMKYFDQALEVCLMYKLKTSARHHHELYISYARETNTHRTQ